MGRLVQGMWLQRIKPGSNLNPWEEDNVYLHTNYPAYLQRHGGWMFAFTSGESAVSQKILIYIIKAVVTWGRLFQISGYKGYGLTQLL